MGGPSAEQLFREQGDIVLRRARQLLRSEDEAREALQEVFTALLVSPPRWSEIPSTSAYLYGVTTHLCLNRLRARRTHDRLLQERAPELQGLQGAERARAEDGAMASQLLATMPPDLATVTIYYYVDEMSQAEIAEVMGCSRRHVGNLLERARAFIARTERNVA